MDKHVMAVIRQKMEQEGLPDLATRLFLAYVEELKSGATGMIPEPMIQALSSLPDAEHFPDSYREKGREALSRTVMLKLNGGLGTGMGLSQAKSLLEVRDGKRFLDVILMQVKALRLRYGVQLPLVLMNSFSTDKDTLDVIQADADFMEGQGSLPVSFLQHKVPKLLEETLLPVAWPDNPEQEWCPPGHGDLYTALTASGLLDQLVEAGHEYAFVSNSDNLGAILDCSILGYFAESGSSFMMEAADRTEADRKGGHLAMDQDGRLLLRESAQCPNEDMDAFQDTMRHRFFNTNTIWLNLRRLQDELRKHEGLIRLSVIANRKTVDPLNDQSPAVLQIETAMGSAIHAFPDACAIRVPRFRFAPVKTTDDLLVLGSDHYELTREGEVRPLTPASQRTVVRLDPRYYKKIDDFKARFPRGFPELKHCRSLNVLGDVLFEPEQILMGDVTLFGGEKSPEGSVQV